MELLDQLCKETNLDRAAIVTLIDMRKRGFSIPFIVDYRSEEAHHISEDKIRDLFEKQDEILSEKELDEEPTPQKDEKAAADPVKEKLTELAERILKGTDLNEPLESIALNYTMAEQGVTSADHVLSRVRDIIVEKIVANRRLRRSLKNTFIKSAKFASQLKAGAVDKKGEYRRFHQFSAPLGRMSPEDALMVLRGEKRKILTMQFSINDEETLKQLCSAVIHTDVPIIKFQLETVVAEAYHQHLKLEIEKELRADLVARAEKMVLADCANMLRQALYHPVLTGKKQLVIDANKDSGYSMVLVDAQEKIVRSEKFAFAKKAASPTASAEIAIEPTKEVAEEVETPPQNEVPTENSEQNSESVATEGNSPSENIASNADAAIDKPEQKEDQPHINEESGKAAIENFLNTLKDFIVNGKPDVLVLAKKPETRLIQVLIRRFLAKENLTLPHIGLASGVLPFEVSAQQLEHEYTGIDPDFLRPVAMARRLINPVAELAAVSPLSLTLHALQDDISQAKLLIRLREEFEKIIRPGGVDINQASAGMLRYVPGMDPDTAKAIVRFRRQNGRYKARTDLTKIPGMTADEFLQIAGFVRVYDGSNPLDKTRIHPERYEALRKVAEHLQQDFNRILNKPEILHEIDPQKFARPGLSAHTLKGLLEEMRNPYTKNPNPPLEILPTDPKLIETKDLVVGTILKGRITHLTDYGAFVDIGIHHDGLVHKTEMARDFVKEPTRYLRLGQVVAVKVAAVDVAKNRITLVMKDVQQPRPAQLEVARNADSRDFRAGQRGQLSRDQRGSSRGDGRGQPSRDSRAPRDGRGPDRGPSRGALSGRDNRGPGDRPRRPDNRSEKTSERRFDSRPPRPFKNRDERPAKKVAQPSVFGTFGEAFKKFLPAKEKAAAPQEPTPEIIENTDTAATTPPTGENTES